MQDMNVLNVNFVYITYIKAVMTAIWRILNTVKRAPSDRGSFYYLPVLSFSSGASPLPNQKPTARRRTLSKVLV